MSPPNAAVMSPPQSVTMSPPQSTMQNSVSPPLLQQQQQLQHHASSPIKSRSTQLPTSPTHMAAMRGATHQRRHQASFDFGSSNDHQAQNQQMYMNRQNQFLYPTPPQEQGGHNNSFLSPSPDSPDQWSSASPQSHSDWSEGIHSPPSVMNGGGGHFQHPQHLQQHQMINQQTTDAVII